jgi:uncharacterized membrane protein
MSYYEVLLFLHIAGSIVWLGSGLLLQLLGIRADASGDPKRIKTLVEEADWLSTRLFIPTSLAVFVLGVLLVIEGPWSFGDLWIVLGLIGYATTFLTGIALITPQAKRIGRAIEREGGVGPVAVVEIRRIFLISRVDLVVLFTVVADMALKPTGDDVGTLVLMAAIVAVAAAYSFWRFRASAPAGSVGEMA